RYNSALSLAGRALLLHLASEERGRAMYVLAGAEERLGHPQRAIAQYMRLLRMHPPRYLDQSAKECLALLSERYGDPLRAIDIYRRLDYNWDFAYLADARLSPNQLGSYLESLPPGTPRNVLTYTLGMRYLRIDQFEEARRVFRKLPKKVRSNWGLSLK